MRDEIVAVEAVSRVFGRTIALADVTLSVVRGTVFGLVGENGAGKTTLIKHLLGLYRAERGRVCVFGCDPVRDPQGVLGRIGYLSEDRDLPEWMRVGELMSYTRAFYPRWDDGLAGELLEMFELDAGQKIRTLSRGQRARAGLLVAVAHRPDLLLLDEPSSGLDPGARLDILAAIVRTVADEGRTVLLSSHLLHEVQRVADRVGMLHHGRLMIDEPLDELLARHRALTVRFAAAPAVPPAWPEAFGWTGQGAEWSCLCNGQTAACRRMAEEAGAAIVEERAPSLDEIFLAYTRRDVTGSSQP
jgi:ABC-2 type transport system ATP-binding protein